MDLQIEKDGQVIRLSDFGVIMTGFVPGSPSVNTSRDDINFKNGKLFNGATHSERKITLSGYYVAENNNADRELQDELNALFASLVPYKITEMIGSGDMYGYERPGQTTGFNYQDGTQSLYKYGYKVLLDDVISYDFQGKTDGGLLTAVSLSFVTADIPYGITKASNVTLTGKTSILYDGTASISQLDWPFYLQLTASADQGYTFDVVIDGVKFTYTATGKEPIKLGDKFDLKGISFTLNGRNINDQTNIQYFTLRPTANKQLAFSTTFVGDVVLKNKVDFYV